MLIITFDVVHWRLCASKVQIHFCSEAVSWVLRFSTKQDTILPYTSLHIISKKHILMSCCCVVYSFISIPNLPYKSVSNGDGFGTFMGGGHRPGNV